MIQFYSPDIVTSGKLPDSESQHCCRVLRHKEGDEVYVTDGQGSRYLCRITDANPHNTSLEILDKVVLDDTTCCRIILAVAPTKNSDRMEWMAEKCVELGVSEIVLLKCSRSERKIMKTERLQKVMISAMKQSLGVKLPLVREITSFKQFVNSFDKCFQKFFGYCSPEFQRKEFVKEYMSGSDVIVMIGPEGDFSPEEVNLSIEAGFVPVTFGNRRLRTETACVFAVSAVDTINQLK